MTPARRRNRSCLKVSSFVVKRNLSVNKKKQPLGSTAADGTSSLGVEFCCVVKPNQCFTADSMTNSPPNMMLLSVHPYSTQHTAMQNLTSPFM